MKPGEKRAVINVKLNETKVKLKVKNSFYSYRSFFYKKF